MSIDRDLLESLNKDDLVTAYGWEGLCVSGPVGRNSDGSRWMGGYLRLTDADGQELPAWTQQEGAALTINQRAPRPIYINHPRTQPHAGDVARPEGRTFVLLCRSDHEWVDQDGDEWHSPPRPLRLLVDGKTGQVVQ